jgi:hypothetical protein
MTDAEFSIAPPTPPGDKSFNGVIVIRADDGDYAFCVNGDVTAEETPGLLREAADRAEEILEAEAHSP